MTDDERNAQAPEGAADDLELQEEHAEQVAGGRKAGETPLEYMPIPPPPPPTTK